MNSTVTRLIYRVDNIAALPGDTPAQRLHKTLLVFLSAFALTAAPCAAIYLNRIGLAAAAGALVVYTLASLLAGAHLLLSKRESIGLWTHLGGLLATPFAVQWLAGGYSASGGAVQWSLLAPLLALVFHGPRWACAWFAAFALLVLISGGNEIALGATTNTVLLLTENVLLLSTLAFIAMRFFMVEREKAQLALELAHQQLRREQKRSEDLLLNILPAPIAERLMAGQKTVADGFAEVTVLFADIVGFTQLANHTSPEQLVELLNQLFSRFDRLVDEIQVEKIKTIGDAYMVCAGLPTASSDHAEAIAILALRMRDAIAAYNLEFNTDLRVRIGINTGPVVAGVIGLKKFIYDIWGDTVNLASRMESHGVPGCIQLTAATRRKLGPAYQIEERGMVDVKGVGAVQTYFLISRSPSNLGA